MPPSLLSTEAAVAECDLGLTRFHSVLDLDATKNVHKVLSTAFDLCWLTLNHDHSLFTAQFRE